jgi:hypothetical protein
MLVISFLCIPALAFAWGPLTHIYLGNELCSLGAFLPAGVVEIIRRYRKDFIYGNLMADIIVGKKYLPDHKNSHNWGFAFDLLQASETRQQKAFSYGYLSHLAADTVAHHVYTADKKNIRHTVLEMKADCIIDKKYRQLAMQIDRKIQIRNDVFLENSLDRFIFSFKTNKRILRGMVYLTVFYPERIGDFIDRNLLTTLPARETIEKLHRDSLDNIVDLFQNWEKSEVVKINPIGNRYRKSLFKNELKSFLFKPLRKSDIDVAGYYKRLRTKRFRNISSSR